MSCLIYVDFSIFSEDEINIETAEPDPNVMAENIEITESQEGDLYPDSSHNKPALIAGLCCGVS